MRTQGWHYEFVPRPWTAIEAEFSALAEQRANFRYMHDIAASVIASGKTNELAARTAIHDLLVASEPVGVAPLEVVRVRAPDSVHHAPPAGHVRIEHQSHSGRNDELERPETEAVALFWRFMIEKFGITPIPPA